jgi:ATP-dependent RNA helicase RhlE
MSIQADRRHAAVVPIRAVPAGPPSFTDLGVSRQVAETLRMRGISEPFPIQTLVLGDALAGRDVLARSRTGSGKTLAFAVPIVERVTPGGGSPNALILAPTRELASQVTEEFRAIADVKRLRVAAVYGGVGLGPGLL